MASQSPRWTGRPRARALRHYLAGRPAAMPVWPGSWPLRAAAMIRIDLSAAAVAYRDQEGNVADFHALRHSYITLLSRSGASPKVAQELARHSDIRLTMNVYTHAGLYDLAGAVDALPSLLSPCGRPEQITLVATGTDGPAQPDRALTKTMRPDGVPVRADATTQVQHAVGFPFQCHQQNTPENIRLGFNEG